MGGQGQVVRAEVMARRRAEQRRGPGVATLVRRRCRFPARSRSRHPQETIRAPVRQVDGVEGRLRGDAVSTHPGSCSHAGREGRARFALQVDAKAVGVLGVLQQEPGTGEGLLAGGAGVTARLVFV